MSSVENMQSEARPPLGLIAHSIIIGTGGDLDYFPIASSANGVTFTRKTGAYRHKLHLVSGIVTWTDRLHSVRVVTWDALFSMLASRWRVERGATSSITKIALCPSYQRIIAMGELAVPMILREMEREGEEVDMWFWALQAITGADPVDHADRGDMSRMARAWFDWAWTNGYAW